MANGARMGGGVQRARPPGVDRRQGAGAASAVEPRAAPGAEADRRGRPRPSGGRGGALAADRSGTVDLCRVWYRDQQTDAQPDVAPDGLSQALGPAAPSCPGPRRAGGFQKGFAARLAEIARSEAAGRPIEVWFSDETRIGQKNKITRRWARRGTRPSAPRDQRTHWPTSSGRSVPAR